MAGFGSSTLIVMVVLGTIAFIIGWWGWGELKQPNPKVLAGTAFFGWIGALVAFIFLSLMHSASLKVWLWFLLGIGLESQRIGSGREYRDRIAPLSTPSLT